VTEDGDELVQAIRQGSEEAVTGFVRKHWGRSHRLAFLIVGDAAAAEDVTQEAMMSALRGLEGFDANRPIEPWLHRIVVNEARDALRARARRPELISGLEDADAEAAPEPALPRGLPDELLEAIRALRPDYRFVVVLRHVLDYTPAEIAEVLAIPGPTVRTRLRRALIELREALQPKEAANGLTP
jgi:RNA polymerase sigma-70 factor (ECF subfamily)